ncbi:flavin reductase [Herbiconiux sp. KACC 21604]|uniref:flavin reductase n=1 Tax=unclassified Herbiconiux TaxID=2618217 RepID=UPI00149322E7|nr:flavin reductase [Herbiconiux sp. SALV-R1]QJU54134.1 FCD domain-containing protein [Herbiconiux sp. SALV-R1]WPO85186.1 flavin reductase [Herbiconiux sp. KACC 21604]
MTEVEITADGPSKGEFRDVMGRFASGVTVITTTLDGEDLGAAASAVSSLSDEPPSLLICLNVTSTTAQAIVKTGTFAVNVLAEDSAPIAQRFASKAPDKFQTIAVERGQTGVPLIAGCIAHFECVVDETVRGGTHLVFLARVVRVSSKPGNPLAYFRGSFGRMETAPDAAALHAVRDYVVGAVTDEAQPLDAEAIAAELDIEVGRAYQSLVALTTEGLVRRTGATFQVEPVPDQVIFDYYAAKLAIEIGAAAQTVGAVGPDQLAELRTLLEATLEFSVDGQFSDPEGWIRANSAFHEYLVGLAGSVILTETYKGLRLPAMEQRSIRESTRATAALHDDHRAIVEGYEKGDVELVLRTLTAHAKRPQETRAEAAATASAAVS